MYRIAIVDAFCPRPYDELSLLTDPTGGTESSVVLLAEALSARTGIEVRVLQHCRTDTHISARGTRYEGASNWREAASAAKEDAVVIINSHKVLDLWHRNRRQLCTLVLWRHNYLGNHYKRLGACLQRCQAQLVCVSPSHLSHSRERLKNWSGYPGDRYLSSLPNPVKVHRSAASIVDPDKLLYCSSPHKGLDQCLELFRHVRQSIPSLRLYVCNPGYMADAVFKQEGVITMGAMNRRALHRHMAESLCIFYPQTRFRETFGLVATEANALGTPVLAPTDFGALPDVIHHLNPLLPTANPDSIVSQLRTWRDHGRPAVAARSEFSPNTVARQWLDLLRPAHSTRRADASHYKTSQAEVS